MRYISGATSDRLNSPAGSFWSGDRLGWSPEQTGTFITSCVRGLTMAPLEAASVLGNPQRQARSKSLYPFLIPILERLTKLGI